MATGVKHVKEKVSLLEKLQNSLVFVLQPMQTSLSWAAESRPECQPYLWKHIATVHFYTQPRFCLPITSNQKTHDREMGANEYGGSKIKGPFYGYHWAYTSALGISIQDRDLS